MKNKPLVSVAMITYNHEKYIETAINSVLIQQTDFDIELIVSNDSSTDKTDAIIQNILKTHSKAHLIRYIKHETNLGMMANVIDTLKLCDGDYIAFCEGDDYWIEPLKLKYQINEMRNHPQCYLSFHPANEVINNCYTGKIWGYQFNENKIFTPIEMFRKIGGVFCPTAAIIIHRKAIEPFPDFLNNAPVGDDFIQMLGSAHGGALFIAKTMSAYRREHPNAWNTVVKEKNLTDMLLFIKNINYSYLKSLNEMRNFIDEKYQKEIDRKIAEKLFGFALFCLNYNVSVEFKDAIIKSYKITRISILQTILYYVSFCFKLSKYVFLLYNKNQAIIKYYVDLKSRIFNNEFYEKS